MLSALDMQTLNKQQLSSIFGGAGPQKKCDSHGPDGVNPFGTKDPKSTWNNTPGIVPTIGGPSILHPIIPCRETPQVNPPSLKNPGAAPSITSSPKSMTA